MTQYRSEFIQRLWRIVIFMFSLFLVADGHLGLPSQINLKRLRLQILPTECSAFHEILAFWRIKDM